MVWSLVIGAVAGAAANGISSYLSNKTKVDAAQNMADTLKSAADKYSGEKANVAMTERGKDMARSMTSHDLGQASRVNQNGGSLRMTNALSGMENIGNVDMTQGHGEGRAQKATELNSRYGYDTAEAQRALKQADIRAGAIQQGTQSAMSGLSDIIGTFKNASDENEKEPINNDSGLPPSDIEDSLRQLETVSYQYKDPSVPGCDGEVHESGFTAQSMEKTPMGKRLGVVKEGNDGVKRVDEWKLMEALTAGIAQMQREIDELEEKNGVR